MGTRNDMAGVAEKPRTVTNWWSAEPEAPKNPPSSQIDYSDAMIVESDNNKSTAIGQLLGQEFAMQQSSMDRELKSAADFELQMETFDAKLQMNNLEYKQGMKSEENRHLESLATLQSQHQDYSNMTQSSGDDHPDLPPPPTDESLFGPKTNFA